MSKSIIPAEIKIPVTNLFSPNMFDRKLGSVTMKVTELTLDEVKSISQNLVNVVRRTSISNIFSNLLGIEPAYVKHDLHVKEGDIVLVGYLHGTRVPNKATELPEGTYIRWFLFEHYN